jgi:hypothetical protein
MAMNKTRKTLLSVLLAIALLLPMAPAAKADGEVYATNVAVEPTTNENIYYRSDVATTVTLYANVTTSNGSAYNGTYSWSSNGTSLSAPTGNLSSVTLTAQSTGSTTVTVTVQTSATETVSSSYAVNVLADDVSKVEFSANSATIQVGQSTTLTATASYLSGKGTPSVAYSSDKPAVATVSATGVVTGVTVGTATITAKSGSKEATATITVTPKDGSVTAATTIGKALTLTDVASQISTAYKASYGSAPADSAVLVFNSLGNASVGALTLGGKRVVDFSQENSKYYFSDLKSMVFTPSANGSYTFKYTVDSFTGTVTISVTTPTKDIRIPISSSGEYRFDRVGADGSSKSGATLITDALGKTSDFSIKFGAVQSGSDVGTLFTSMNANLRDRVVKDTVVTWDAVSALYFIPSRAGTYSIAYEAYLGNTGGGTMLCRGSLIIPVDSASLNVVVNLDSVAPYTFSASPRSGVASAASLLVSTINSAVGGNNWSGIKFDGAASATNTVGTLHEAVGYRTILASDYIASGNIARLYFEPAQTGAYEITYGVYGSQSSSAPIATGKLTINVSNMPTGSADFTYTTTVGGTVQIKESDFVNFFQNKQGSRYSLSSVVFNEYTGSNSFLHDNSRFVPFNSPDLYTSTYAGTLPQNAHFLDRLSFTAPKTSGFTVVQFTCYGGTSANASNVKASGRFTIFYTDTDVPSVTYSAYSASTVDFGEADFVSVYQTVMKTNAARPAFDVRLLSVPGDGTLYRYYSKTGRTPLTAAGISGYTFTVNGTDTDSVSKLSYVPGRGTTGSESVTYAAYDKNGTMLYIGEIRFKLSIDRSAVSYSDGLAFQATDFYSATDSDPVIYVTFQKPESGRIYVYTNNRYIEAPNGTKFYTVSNADGAYPISAALYAPKANQAGSVTLTCVAHRRSGASYEDVISVNVLSKNASTTFGDVTGTIGWAANSIDFSKRLGLVGGTSTNPPLFSPRDTMRRCDLVLILYRLAGSPATVGTMPYSDLPAASSSSYAAEINNSALWAYRNGVMQNVVTGTLYAPNTALTRQDFAQILCNYTKAMGGNTSTLASIANYSDASQVGTYALEGVSWAVANGYITSASTNSLVIEPQRAATRAEIVTLLHRYLTY